MKVDVWGFLLGRRRFAGVMPAGSWTNFEVGRAPTCWLYANVGSRGASSLHFFLVDAVALAKYRAGTVFAHRGPGACSSAHGLFQLPHDGPWNLIVENRTEEPIRFECQTLPVAGLLRWVLIPVLLAALVCGGICCGLNNQELLVWSSGILTTGVTLAGLLFYMAWLGAGGPARKLRLWKMPNDEKKGEPR